MGQSHRIGGRIRGFLVCPLHSSCIRAQTFLLTGNYSSCIRGCPIYWKVHQLILGLKPLESHAAIAAKDVVLNGLKNFGIEPSDIFLTMSDTASTALKTGREILEASYDEEAGAGRPSSAPINRSDPGTCDMHVLNLIVDHASGKKTRTQNKVVVDEFVPGATLRSAQLCVISHINNKRQKVSHHYFTTFNAATFV